MWYGKFLTRKDCREHFDKGMSAMVLGDGRQYSRTPFNHTFDKYFFLKLHDNNMIKYTIIHLTI